MWLGHYHHIFNYTRLLACVRADGNADDRSNTIPRRLHVKKKKVSMSRKYHNHKLQTNPLHREEERPGGGGGGYSDIFGSAHFGGFKILNFNIFGGFQKNEYFRGV